MMKYILLLLLISSTAGAQITGKFQQPNPGARGVTYNGIQALKEFYLPQFDTTYTPIQEGAIVFRTADTSVYIYKGNKWRALGTGSANVDISGKLDAIKKPIITTVAGLRALTNTQSDVVYQTTDYGGGTWSVKGLSDGTLADNTGTIIITTDGYVLQRQIGQAVLDTWFGFSSDTTLDQTVTLGKAVLASAGKTLFITGTYTAEMVPNIGNIIIDGQNKGKLKLKLNNSVFDRRIFEFNNKNNITFRNLNFDCTGIGGDDTNPSQPLRFTNCDNIHIENCTFKNGNVYPVKMLNTSNLWFVGNSVFNTDTGIIGQGLNWNVWVNENTFDGGTSEAVNFFSDVANTRPHDIHVTNNHIKNKATSNGIEMLNAYNLEISRNDIYNTVGGIVFHASGFVNNLFCDSANVSFNTINKTSGPGIDYLPSNSTATGNNLYNIGSNGIFVSHANGSTTKNVKLSLNTIDGYAYANGYAAIKTVNVIHFDVSNNTTLNAAKSISNSGIEFEGCDTGSITINNSDNIILSNDNNFNKSISVKNNNCLFTYYAFNYATSDPINLISENNRSISPTTDNTYISGTTLDPNTYNSSNAYYLASTTVNVIRPSWKYRTISIQATDNNVIVQNSSSIQLQSASDYTITSGMFIELQYNPGVGKWVQVGADVSALVPKNAYSNDANNYFDNGGAAKTGVAYRNGNIVSGLSDHYTGEQFTASLVTTKPDGTAYTNADIDGVVIFKKGDEYFRRNTPVNILNFGADRTGITDSKAAMQAALNSAIANKYPYQIPSGTFKIASFTASGSYPYGGTMRATSWGLIANGDVNVVLDKNAKVLFDNGVGGNDKAGIKFTGRTTITGSDNSSVFQMLNVSDYSGQLLHFEGTRARKSSANISNIQLIGGYEQIDFYDYMDGVYVDNVTFDTHSGIGGFGILADDCRWFKNVRITNNTFIGGGEGDAIEINNDNATITIADNNKVLRQSDEWTENVFIQNNTISNYLSTNIGGSGIGIGFAGKCYNIIVDDNTIDKAREGIHFEFQTYDGTQIPKNVFITKNKVLGITSTPGLSLLGHTNYINTVDNMNFNVEGNTFEVDSSYAGYAVAIIGVRGAKFYNNTVRSYNSAFPHFAHSIAIAQNGTTDIELYKNTITNFSTAIGFVGAASTALNVSRSVIGNKITDCDVAYFLDEFISTYGDLVVNGNTYNGVRRMFQSSVIQRNLVLTGFNEKVAGVDYASINYIDDNGWGVHSSTKGMSVYFDNQSTITQSFRQSSFRNDVFRSGERVNNIGGLVKRIVTSGSLEDFASDNANDLTVTGASGSNILSYSASSLPIPIIEGKAISVAGVTFPTDAFIYRIDEASKKIYLTANLPSVASGIMKIRTATYVDDYPALNDDVNLTPNTIVRRSSDGSIAARNGYFVDGIYISGALVATQAFVDANYYRLIGLASQAGINITGWFKLAKEDAGNPFGGTGSLGLGASGFASFEGVNNGYMLVGPDGPNTANGQTFGLKGIMKNPAGGWFSPVEFLHTGNVIAGAGITITYNAPTGQYVYSSTVSNPWGAVTGGIAYTGGNASVTTGAIMPGRFTTSQMNALTNITTGAVVFNTDWNSIAQYEANISDGVAGWRNLSLSKPPRREATASTALTTNDGTIRCTAGTFSITAGAIIIDQVVSIVNTGTGTVTMTGNTFNGNTTAVIGPGHSMTFQYTGTDYIILNQL